MTRLEKLEQNIKTLQRDLKCCKREEVICLNTATPAFTPVDPFNPTTDEVQAWVEANLTTCQQNGGTHISYFLPAYNEDTEINLEVTVDPLAETIITSFIVNGDELIVDPITVIDSDPLFVYTDELSLLFAAWLLLHPEVEATFDDTDLVNGNITITDIFSDLIITIGYTYDGDPLETTDTVLMTESVGTCEDPLFVWVLSQDGNITRIDYISADPIVYGDGEANRIAYWQDTDTITSDTDLYWNSANNRLGIGTSAPTASIEISSDTSSSVILDMATNSSNRPLVSFKRSRGTIASKLAVIENDKLGSLTFSGSDGTNHNVSGGLVECFVDGAVSSNVVPARLSFVTGTSISNRYERLTVKADGNVGIGTTTPTIAKLEVNGATLTQHRVEANTDGVGSPNLITAQETRSIFTNEGTAALNYHTLPTAVAGLTYTFYVADIDGIRVVANTGDIIQINGIASSVAGYCESLVIGSSVTLTAINATDWVAISSLGTWNLA